jgi:hypothetical protein
LIGVDIVFFLEKQVKQDKKIPRDMLMEEQCSWAIEVKKVINKSLPIVKAVQPDPSMDKRVNPNG